MTLWEIVLIGVSLSMDAFAVSIADGMILPVVIASVAKQSRISVDYPGSPRLLQGLRKGVEIAMTKKAMSPSLRAAAKQSLLPPIIALTFGIFQAVMPMAGYALVVLCGRMGQSVYNALHTGGHWVAMGLLCLLGGKMIMEGIASHHKDKKDASPVIASPKGEAISPYTEIASQVAQEGRNRNDVKAVTPVTLFVQGVATSIDALAVGISLGAVGGGIVHPALIIGATTTVICLPAVYLGRRAERYAGKWAAVAGGAVLAAIGVKIGIAG